MTGPPSRRSQDPIAGPRRTPARSFDPTLTRKGGFSHPGTLILAAVAIVFTAYILGYLPQLDPLFSRIESSTRTQGLPIIAPILIGLVGLFVLILVLIALRAILNALSSGVRALSFSGRPYVSVEDFQETAAGRQISARVAKETYDALTAHYPSKMSIQLADDLRLRLHFTQDNILFLQSRLLNRCDRREVIGFSPTNLRTVQDLLQHIETAPPQHVPDNGIRRRNNDPNPASTSTSNDRPSALRLIETDRTLTSVDRRVNRHTASIRPAGDKTRQPAEPSAIRNVPAGDDPHFLPPRKFDASGLAASELPASEHQRRSTDGSASTAPGSAAPGTTEFFRPRRSADFTPVRRSTDVPPSTDPE